PGTVEKPPASPRAPLISHQSAGTAPRDVCSRRLRTCGPDATSPTRPSSPPSPVPGSLQGAEPIGGADQLRRDAGVVGGVPGVIGDHQVRPRPCTPALPVSGYRALVA